MERPELSSRQRAAIAQVAFEVALRGALDRLAGAGIEALVLKGPHLAATVYPDRLERTFQDLDLLVRPADFPVAVEALTAGGLSLLGVDPARRATAAGYHNAQFRTRSGILIELHRDLSGHGRYPVDIPALFERTERFRFGEVEARGLATEELLLHLCLHMLKSYFDIERKHLRDIGLLLERRPVDWERFLGLAGRAGCRGGAWCVFEAVRNLEGRGVPAGVSDRLRPTGLRMRLLQRALDWESFPVYRRAGRSLWRTQFELGLPLIDRAADWPMVALRYGRLRLFDLLRRALPG